MGNKRVETTHQCSSTIEIKLAPCFLVEVLRKALLSHPTRWDQRTLPHSAFGSPPKWSTRKFYSEETRNNFFFLRTKSTQNHWRRHPRNWGHPLRFRAESILGYDIMCNGTITCFSFFFFCCSSSFPPPPLIYFIFSHSRNLREDTLSVGNPTLNNYSNNNNTNNNNVKKNPSDRKIRVTEHKSYLFKARITTLEVSDIKIETSCQNRLLSSTKHPRMSYSVSNKKKIHRTILTNSNAIVFKNVAFAGLWHTTGCCCPDWRRKEYQYKKRVVKSVFRTRSGQDSNLCGQSPIDF